MNDKLKSRFQSYIGKKDLRSRKVARNIVFSFVVKAGSIAVGLLLVPLTLHYVGSAEYGIWLTISSVVGWLSFFDIGLSNGLQTKLTAALTEENYAEARVLVSTTYAVIALVAVALFAVFVTIVPLFDWNNLFNLAPTVGSDIRYLVLIVVSTFCLQFVFQIINTILIAHHEPARASLLTLIGQSLVLASVYALTVFVPADLATLILVLTINPILVLGVASVVLFGGRYQRIAPSFRHVDFRFAKPLFSLGLKYFVIQIGMLLLFQTNIIILAKMLGPNAVTQLNVTNKLYQVVLMVFTIIIIPYWSAFTESYTQADFAWMRDSMARIRKTLAVCSLGIPLLCVLSPYIFKLWLADSVEVPMTLSVSTAFYTVAYMGIVAHSSLINGVGKIRLVLYLYALSSLLNVPVAIAMTRWLGVSGPVVSNALIMTLMAAILWIQVDKIIGRRDVGVWGK